MQQLRKASVSYRVVNNTAGYIRLRIPSLKRVPLNELKRLSDISTPVGIKDVKVNPITGSLTIQYDLAKIDIMEFINSMMSHTRIRDILQYTGDIRKI